MGSLEHGIWLFWEQTPPIIHCRLWIDYSQSTQVLSTFHVQLPHTTLWHLSQLSFVLLFLQFLRTWHCLLLSICCCSWLDPGSRTISCVYFALMWLSKFHLQVTLWSSSVTVSHLCIYWTGWKHLLQPGQGYYKTQPLAIYVWVLSLNISLSFDLLWPRFCCNCLWFKLLATCDGNSCGTVLRMQTFCLVLHW